MSQEPPPNYRLPKQRRRRKLSKVDGVLRSVFKKYGIEHKLHRYTFVQYWPEVVGEELAKRSRPQRIHGETLIVTVKNSAWAQEMSFLKKTILERLKKYLQRGVHISDVRFVVQDER